LYPRRQAQWARRRDMAGQPRQGPEDDFLDQFFSMAGGSYSAAAAGGGRAAGDQPFSLALSLDAAAAEASGSGKHAEGGKTVRALPRLYSAVSAFPFSGFCLCTNQTSACVLCAKLLARLFRIGRPCSSPGFSRRCSAVVCSRPTSAPARLPRYYARTAAEVWKSCVFSWLIGVLFPPNHAISFCFLVGF